MYNKTSNARLNDSLDPRLNLVSNNIYFFVSVISCFFMTPTLVLYMYVYIYIYIYIYIYMYPYSYFSFYSLVIFFVLSPVDFSAPRVIEVVWWSHHDVIIASLSFLFLCDLYFYIYSVVFLLMFGHFSMSYPFFVFV
jgi:hypothetical protein